MLELYRTASDARAKFAVVQPLCAEVLNLGSDLVGVRRGDLVVVVNASMQPVAVDLEHPELSIAQPVFSSEPSEMHTPGVIPSNSTVWFTSRDV